MELDAKAVEAIAEMVAKLHGRRAAHFVVERIAEGKPECVATWLRVYDRLIVYQRIVP